MGCEKPVESRSLRPTSETHEHFCPADSAGTCIQVAGRFTTFLIVFDLVTQLRHRPDHIGTFCGAELLADHFYKRANGLF